MRTNVVIDDKLMEMAKEIGGYRTKRAAIEAGLELLVQMAGQEKLRSLRGRVDWEGNLEEMREDGNGAD